MRFIQRFFGHLRTITEHRHRVIAHCAKAGILWQGLGHDLSKYGPTEFWQGVRFYNGRRSPTEDERKTYGYSVAWMHHKGRNRHHWEYWTDYSMEEKRYVAMPMPRRYLAEMICDRVAASKTYRKEQYRDGDPLDYLLHGKVRDAMNPQTEKELRMFLTELAEQGEETMFSHLRQWARGKEEPRA